MSNNNTPDNWRNKVTKQSFSRFPEKKQNHERDIWIDGVHFGAIEKQVEYATKLHEAQQENEKLKAIANLWRPLMEEVVKRFEGVAEMADQDYDLNLIKQIKRFLYGE